MWTNLLKTEFLLSQCKINCILITSIWFDLIHLYLMLFVCIINKMIRFYDRKSFVYKYTPPSFRIRAQSNVLEKCYKGPSINDVRSLGGGGVSENLTLLNKISKFYTIKVWQGGGGVQNPRKRPDVI